MNNEIKSTILWTVVLVNEMKLCLTKKKCWLDLVEGDRGKNFNTIQNSLIVRTYKEVVISIIELSFF